MYLGGDVIQFQNQSGVGQWDGKPTYGEPFTVAGANVQPYGQAGVAAEQVGNFADISKEYLQAWLPVTSNSLSIAVTSKATYGGKDYQVAGEPNQWKGLSARPMHVLVRLELIK